jgi:hypothetical protein
LKFNIGVGIGEMISGKKIGNSRWPPGAHFVWKKMTIWPVDHYGGLKVGPIVFRIR